MRSLLRTAPLIGALILSAAPVQASKTLQGLFKPYLVSEEAEIACALSGVSSATITTLSTLYGLMLDCRIPKLYEKTWTIARVLGKEYESCV